jgi:hypothetical protein
MEPVAPALNQTLCRVRHVRCVLPVLACDRCGRAAHAVAEAQRTALDIALEGPVVLLVTVSVHHCGTCHHFFRAQPSFLRRDATYTNRVVDKAVRSVYQDGMAIRRVAARLARDFWVQPSEGMIRQWCKTYSAGLDFATDYQAWVVAEFSGILCVDEVYQNRLALLLAVDPAAPEGDRLVGYQLVHGAVDQGDVEGFLGRLAALGVVPEQVITDGAALYPAVLAQVWPTAAHQLCLFHETRAVTTAVQRVERAVRARIPALPRASAQAPATETAQRQTVPTLRGRPRTHPPPAEATDAAALKWRWRQGAQAALHVEVHRLRQQGVSLRGIARQTGLARGTVRRWLHAAPGDGGADGPLATEATAATEPIPPLTLSALPAPPGPPAPWTSWDEVRQARTDLTLGRFLLVRRPDHLTAAEQARLDGLLASPLGAELRVARAFLTDWYAIWCEPDGQRRDREAARIRWQQWREHPDYQAVAPLRRIQQQVDERRFGRLSQFLRQPTWEATNNGAERMGRGFRHQQAPHFTLRTEVAIEGALKAGACLRREEVIGAARPAVSRCQRGRKPRGWEEELRLAA